MSTTPKLLTLKELIGFYVGLTVILMVLGGLISGATGVLVGLLLGAGVSTGLYFTVGKKMIGKPIPLIGGGSSNKKETTQLVVSPEMMNY